MSEEIKKSKRKEKRQEFPWNVGVFTRSVNVTMTHADQEYLDFLANNMGVTRSEYLRMILWKKRNKGKDSD